MSRARVLADLLDSTGDVKLANLDNTTSVTVTDTLTSTSTSEALSANQGKTLKTLADSKEAADSTILKDAAIGVNVQAYDSTIVVDADIGSTVQAYDSTILKNADIGSTVQAYDNVLATVVSSGIGTGANEMVRLNGSAKLPAIDGSNLTNLPASGAWSVKASGNISGDLLITGLTKTTKVIISNLVNATGGGKVFHVLGVGSSYQQGYARATGRFFSQYTLHDGYGSQSSTWMDNGDVSLQVGGGYYNMYLEYTIEDPSDSSTSTLVMHDCVLRNNTWKAVRMSGGHSRNALGAHTSFKITAEAGSLSGGKYTILELN